MFNVRFLYHHSRYEIRRFEHQIWWYAYRGIYLGCPQFHGWVADENGEAYFYEGEESACAFER